MVDVGAKDYVVACRGQNLRELTWLADLEQKLVTCSYRR